MVKPKEDVSPWFLGDMFFRKTIAIHTFSPTLKYIIIYETNSYLLHSTIISIMLLEISPLHLYNIRINAPLALHYIYSHSEVDRIWIYGYITGKTKQNNEYVWFFRLYRFQDYYILLCTYIYIYVCVCVSDCVCMSHNWVNEPWLQAPFTMYIS